MLEIPNVKAVYSFHSMTAPLLCFHTNRLMFGLDLSELIKLQF